MQEKTVMEQIQDQEREELEKVVAYFGNAALLARYLGVTQTCVSDWRKRGRISATAAAQLEERTNGRFKKSELRPDVQNWTV